MKAKDYLNLKQLYWAQRNNIVLDEPDRKDYGYAAALNDNLFRPLQPAVQQDFEKGAGQELKKDMRALHSSSALVVNVFSFWGDTEEKRFQLACACGFCDPDNRFRQSGIRFEGKFPVFTDKIPPHLDVVFDNEQSAKYAVYAVESKFSEPYYQTPGILKDEYFGADLETLWQDIPLLRKFADTLKAPQYECLDAAQLVKHILGLKTSHGKRFRLLYLYYDCFGKKAEVHRRELEEFTTIAKGDGIAFHAKTYQELLFDLYNKYGEAGEYKEYFDYVMGRYF